MSSGYANLRWLLMQYGFSALKLSAGYSLRIILTGQGKNSEIYLFKMIHMIYGQLIATDND